MAEGIAPQLFVDPQQERPACYCRYCGGARFAPGFRCIRCEEEADDT